MTPRTWQERLKVLLSNYTKNSPARIGRFDPKEDVDGLWLNDDDIDDDKLYAFIEDVERQAVERAVAILEKQKMLHEIRSPSIPNTPMLASQRKSYHQAGCETCNNLDQVISQLKGEV